MATKGGLLIAGVILPVDGLEIANPADVAWAKLDPGDYRKRKTSWVHQVIAHTTKGIWPQRVKPGAGPGNADKVVADFWRGDPKHSAAQIVIDRDGTIACLCDLASTCAYHATTSNDHSVGIEIYQDSDGGIWEASLAALPPLVFAICDALGIPHQVCADTYVGGRIVDRMKNGGPDCVGIFGHRDQAWDFNQNTGARGRGDPGDEAYARLIAAGARPLKYRMGEDIELGRERQAKLNARGAALKLDGVLGPASITAMRDRFERWEDLDAVP